MFGGLCFTVGGHMCCGIAGHDLVVRVGPAKLAEALAEPHARPMDFTGRPLKASSTSVPFTNSSKHLPTEGRQRAPVGRGLPGQGRLGILP